MTIKDTKEYEGEWTERPCDDCRKIFREENMEKSYFYETNNPFAPYRTVVIDIYRCKACYHKRRLNGRPLSYGGPSFFDRKREAF